MKRIAPFPCLLLAFTTLLAPARSHAQLPSNATVYAAGLNGPRGLAFGPDGALYVAEAGTGGTTSTKGTCAQVPGAEGPDTGGLTARISKIDSQGHRTTVVAGLPSAQDAMGSVVGVADVAFLEGNLYALIGGGGCAHGNPVNPNAILRVNEQRGTYKTIVDLSTFYAEHPTAYPDVADYDPAGVPYSMLAYNGRLFTVEANHGQIVATRPDGASHVVLDVSLSQGHIVPTSLAESNGNLYLGELGVFPIVPTLERVITLSKDLNFVDTTPGLATKPSELGKFRVAASRAGFTTILSLKFGPDGLLYALEFSVAPGYPTGGAGKVVRLNRNGDMEDVVTGLTVPTGMTFGPDGALYISNLGAAPAGAGQILRVANPL